MPTVPKNKTPKRFTFSNDAFTRSTEKPIPNSPIGAATRLTHSAIRIKLAAETLREPPEVDVEARDELPLTLPASRFAPDKFKTLSVDVSLPEVHYRELRRMSDSPSVEESDESDDISLRIETPVECYSPEPELSPSSSDTSSDAGSTKSSFSSDSPKLSP